MRRLWIALGCLAALAVLTAIGASLWIRSYLRSAEFRQLIAARTSQALKADVTLDPLTWSGSSVFTPQVAASGARSSVLARMEADEVRAEIDWRAIFNGAWRVERIDIQQVNATLQPPEKAEPSAEPAPSAPLPARRGLLPNRFELGEIHAIEANVDLNGVGAVRKSALDARPDGRGWIVDAAGGTLAFAGRPPFDIDSVRLRVQEDAVYLTEARLRLGKGGEVFASGENTSAGFDFQAEWKGVDAAGLMDSFWRKRVSGKVSGHAHATGKPGTQPVTAGDFFLSDGSLQGLPLQSSIATFTNSPQFERIPLHEVSGKFRNEAGSTDVTDFVMESRGLIRVEGRCREDAAGRLDGVFQVGVTSQTLRWLPGSREKVFTDSRAGYQWTSVRVTGTMQSPQEDLSPRLLRAAGEQVIEEGAKAIDQVPGNATDVLDKAVDILAPLIP